VSGKRTNERVPQLGFVVYHQDPWQTHVILSFAGRRRGLSIRRRF
jgi:hypothetical protein